MGSKAGDNVKKLNQLSSIAALKAIANAPTNGLTVVVTGYATGGDGGGGLYRWDSSSVAADNGGTILQLDIGGNGRFIKLY